MNARDYTYNDLALLSHIPISTLTKIGCGLTPNPGYDTMCAIAQALNCSLDEFSDRGPLLTYGMEEYIYRFNQLPSHQQEYIKYVINTEFDRKLYLKSKEKISLKCFKFTCIVNGLAEYESMVTYDLLVDHNYLSQACTYCVQLQTDTLKPKFFKGAVLGFLYDETMEPKNGEIWIVLLPNGLLYIGRYYKKKDTELLKALNGTIEDMVIDNPFELKMMGRFMGTLKN